MRFLLLRSAPVCALCAFVLTAAALCSEDVVAQETLRFGAVSIKPLSPDLFPMPTPGGGVLPTGRVRIRALTAADLIRWAYPEFRGRADQMLGTPAWANLDLFEVEAVFDPETLKQQLPVEPIGRYPGVPPAVTLMMRTLLQERFGLRTHVEERPLDVIAITLLNVDGQLGPKLRRSQSKCPTLVAGVCGIPLRNGSPRFYEAVGVPFSRFVGILEQAIDDPVRDLTGLEGLFDFELPLYSQGELPGRDSIFSVLQQQHGLSLQRRRVQGRHLVVDEIRKHSPNLSSASLWRKEANST